MQQFHFHADMLLREVPFLGGGGGVVLAAQPLYNLMPLWTPL